MQIVPEVKVLLDAIAAQAAAITIEVERLVTIEVQQGQIAVAETPFPAPVGTFTPINFKGVNIAGGENQYPSSSQYNYIYPQNSEIDYFAGKGMGLIRMPVSTRRLQPVSYGMLDPIGRTDEPAVSGSTPGTHVNLEHMKSVIDYACSKNMFVVIDPHDYGTIFDTNANVNRLIGTDTEGTAQFVDWWTRVATKFKNYPNVIFGLINEPNAQSPADWKAGAVAAINAIAAVTTLQWVFIPGTAWTGAHSWVSSGNAAAWTGYSPPPGLKIAFEMHQYLDSDCSGSHAVCSFDAAAAMVGATEWARAEGKKIFIGEFGWSQDASCSALSSAMMAFLTTNKDVHLGWAYWVGGSVAFYGSYMFTVQPPPDRPQMGILLSNLS